LLAIENARLKSLLYNRKDSTTIAAIDSVQGIKAVNVILSKVIRNSFNIPDNYLTINSGEKEGIKTDMGVVNDLGIVGIVEKTSTNFSTVLSILNTKSKINAKLKKSNHFGTLTWNAKSTGFVQLTDVPRLASVRKGDTIVTGGESDIFPGGVNIGTIDRVYTDDETNYYTINVRLFNDMTNLGHVYIIKTKVREEILKLEKETKKNE
jgi:rod shape-determining protein MreC